MPDTCLATPPARVVGYAAAHRRVRQARGRAADYPCVGGCGHLAAEWAYDHQDPNELVAQGSGRWRKPVAYSLDPGRYRPLCKPCHTAADRRPGAWAVPVAPRPSRPSAGPASPRPARSRSVIDLRRPPERIGRRKRCPRCELVKDFGAFSPDRSKANGRTSRCRPCDAAVSAERYARNPQRKAGYDRRNRGRRRAQQVARGQAGYPYVKQLNARHRGRAIEIYGGCCTWCGSIDDLEFDHVNNDGQAHRAVESITAFLRRVSLSGQQCPTWLVQLLCVSCHRGPDWTGRRAAGVPAAGGGASP